MNAETPHQGQVKVWDLFVRVFHWTLIAAFAMITGRKRPDTEYGTDRPAP